MEWLEMSRWKIPTKRLAIVVGAILLTLLLFGSFYLVQPEDVGVVLRLGAYNRTTDPGVHFKIPLVEDVIKVPVLVQQRLEFGFRTGSANRSNSYSQPLLQAESLMLTGDLGIVDMEWIVQYRIVDPQRFLFRVRDVEGTFRNMSESIMRRAVGDRASGDLLAADGLESREIEALVEAVLQELVDQHQMGIRVDPVVLQEVAPPDPILVSWGEVGIAEQLRDRLISEAQEQSEDLHSGAAGEPPRPHPLEDDR